MRDLRVAGRPLKGRDIKVPPGGLQDLVISIAYDTSKLAGKVDQGEMPPLEAGLHPLLRIVWLIAEGEQARFVAYLSRPVKRAGSFEIDGLPPGRYRAFALVQDEAGSVEDPLVARNLAGWSNRRRSEPETTTLALQPAPRLAEIE